jgi:ankyrin repeat protein
VSVLIGTAGVDLNMADNDGLSPLWWAACRGNTQSVRVLLSAKERGLDLDLNQKPTDGSDKGKTPLEIALERNNAEVVALLEEAGASDAGVGVRLYNAARNGKVDEVSEHECIYISCVLYPPHSEPELSTTHSPLPSPLSTTPISPSPILKMAGEDPLQRMGWQHCCPQLEGY